MRLVSHYVRTIVLASLALAVCACQSAQHPATLLPPADPPALKPAAQAAPAIANPSTPTPTPAQSNQAGDGSAQKPASTDATPTAAPSADAVGDLIARVEKEYQDGLDNYHAGKTDDAKQNFDNALNDLLGSNFDVRSDDRLGKEFERIVKGVNETVSGRPVRRGRKSAGTAAKVRACSDRRDQRH